MLLQLFKKSREEQTVATFGQLEERKGVNQIKKSQITLAEKESEKDLKTKIGLKICRLFKLKYVFRLFSLRFATIIICLHSERKLE